MPKTILRQDRNGAYSTPGMTQPAPALTNHLLTRSDLAKLEVPAGDVLLWLAEGWLNQVGTLPSEESSGNPVFAVSDHALRRELTDKLVSIGKTEVVFSTLRVRSVLARTLLPQDPTSQEADAVGEALNDPLESAAAEESGAAELSEALQDAAERVDHEVEACVEMAREEARLDALELAETEAHVADPNPLPEADEGQREQTLAEVPEFELEVDEAPSEDDSEYFDVADLTSHLDSWGDSKEPEPVAEDIMSDASPDHLTDDLTVDIEAAKEPATEPVAAEAPADPAATDDGDSFVESEDQPVGAAEEPTVAATSAEEAAEEPVTEAPVEEPAATDEAAEASEPGAEPEPEAAAPPDPTAADDEENLVEPEAAEILAADDVLPAEPPPEEPIAVADPVAEAPQASEPQPPAAEPESPAEQPAAIEPVTAPTQPSPQEEIATAAIGRVDAFLGELRGTLVDLVQRPQAQPVDMQPFVDAVGEFGQRVEHGVAIGVHAALNSRPNENSGTPAPAQSVRPAVSSSNLVLLGFAFLVLCWAAVFWFKTDSARLAVGTLVGANVIGCCLLAGRRD